MNKKKITGIITAAVLSVPCLSGSMNFITEKFDGALTVHASDFSNELKYNDYLYYEKRDIDSDGTYDDVYITSCDDSAVSIKIPAEIEGLPVTTIYISAFSDCTALTDVTLPENITNIFYAAFANCTSLKNIKFPNTLKEIAGNVFENCTSIKSISLPEGFEFLGNKAFSGCTALENVSLPDSLKTIHPSAFENSKVIEGQVGVKYVDNWVVASDKDITSAQLKEGTKGIAECAFMSCKKLTDINIPDSVMSINGEAFFDTPILDSQEGPVYYAGKWIINCDENAESVEIKNGTTKIADSAFDFCRKLTSIDIPDTVTYIGSLAFYGCSGLKTISLSQNLKTIEQYAFFECTDLHKIFIPESVASIGKSAFAYCSALDEIYFENPDCEIYDSPSTICTSSDENFINYFDGTVICQKDSTALAYAQKYNYNYSINEKVPDNDTSNKLKGDANLDGELNVRDCALIASMLAQGKADKLPENADYNTDNQINVRDAAAIAKHLASSK